MAIVVGLLTSIGHPSQTIKGAQWDKMVSYQSLEFGKINGTRKSCKPRTGNMGMSGKRACRLFAVTTIPCRIRCLSGTTSCGDESPMYRSKIITNKALLIAIYRQFFLQATFLGRCEPSCSKRCLVWHPRQRIKKSLHCKKQNLILLLATHTAKKALQDVFIDFRMCYTWQYFVQLVFCQLFWAAIQSKGNFKFCKITCQ